MTAPPSPPIFRAVSSGGVSSLLSDCLGYSEGASYTQQNCSSEIFQFSLENSSFLCQLIHAYLVVGFLFPFQQLNLEYLFNQSSHDVQHNRMFRQSKMLKCVLCLSSAATVEAGQTHVETSFRFLTCNKDFVADGATCKQGVLIFFLLCEISAAQFVIFFNINQIGKAHFQN